MQVLVNIPDYLYENIKNSNTIFREDERTCYEAVQNGTPLPKDATNGDVFMTMFPNLIWHSIRGDLIGKTSVDMPIGDRWQKNMFYCDTDWWEAPFTREESKE